MKSHENPWNLLKISVSWWNPRFSARYSSHSTAQCFYEAFNRGIHGSKSLARLRFPEEIPKGIGKSVGNLWEIWKVGLKWLNCCWCCNSFYHELFGDLMVGVSWDGCVLNPQLLVPQLILQNLTSCSVGCNRVLCFNNHSGYFTDLSQPEKFSRVCLGCIGRHVRLRGWLQKLRNMLCSNCKPKHPTCGKQVLDSFSFTGKKWLSGSPKPENVCDLFLRHWLLGEHVFLHWPEPTPAAYHEDWWFPKYQRLQCHTGWHHIGMNSSATLGDPSKCWQHFDGLNFLSREKCPPTAIKGQRCRARPGEISAFRSLVFQASNKNIAQVKLWMDRR